MDTNTFQKTVRRAYIRRWIFICSCVVLAILLLGVVNSIDITETSPQDEGQVNGSTTTESTDLFSSTEEPTTTTPPPTNSETTESYSSNTSIDYQNTTSDPFAPTTTFTTVATETETATEVLTGTETVTETATETQTGTATGLTQAAQDKFSSSSEVFIPSQLFSGNKSLIWFLCFLFGIIALGGVIFTQSTPPTFVNQLLKENLPATSIKRRINTFNASLKGIDLKIRFVPRSIRGNWGVMVIESPIEEVDPEMATRIAQRHCIQYDSSSKTFKTTSTSEELFLRALLVARAKKLTQTSIIAEETGKIPPS
ncbi:MAG: hypothetical protein ACFFCQ_14320 [Promethearchaeota archaeon]